MASRMCLRDGPAVPHRRSLMAPQPLGGHHEVVPVRALEPAPHDLLGCAPPSRRPPPHRVDGPRCRGRLIPPAAARSRIRARGDPSSHCRPKVMVPRQRAGDGEPGAAEGGTWAHCGESTQGASPWGKHGRARPHAPDFVVHAGKWYKNRPWNTGLLGRTGLRVSALGFGCGRRGGLMGAGGRARPGSRAAGAGVGARALRGSGIKLPRPHRHRPTGSGESEKNPGQVLARASKPGRFIVGPPSGRPRPRADLADVGGAVARLGRGPASAGSGSRRRGPAASPQPDRGALGEERPPRGRRGCWRPSFPAVRRLQEQGKVRFFGVTASGETGALHRGASRSGAIDTAQAVFNLLNPSGGLRGARGPIPPRTTTGCSRSRQEQRVGTPSGIRVLAGGALERPGGGAIRPRSPSVAPIASGPDYATDARRGARASSRWWPRAMRGAWSRPAPALFRDPPGPALSTVLIGCSDLAQARLRRRRGRQRGPAPPPPALASLHRYLGVDSRTTDRPGRGWRGGLPGTVVFLRVARTRSLHLVARSKLPTKARRLSVFPAARPPQLRPALTVWGPRPMG